MYKGSTNKIIVIAAVFLVMGVIVNKAKPVTKTSDVIFTLPGTLILDKSTIKWLSTLHASSGAVCYQAGYSDAVDDINTRLGLRTSKFRSRPANPFQYTPEIPTYRFVMKDKGGYFQIDNKTYELEFLTGVSNISNGTWERNLNITGVRAYER